MTSILFQLSDVIKFNGQKSLLIKEIQSDLSELSRKQILFQSFMLLVGLAASLCFLFRPLEMTQNHAEVLEDVSLVFKTNKLLMVETSSLRCGQQFSAVGICLLNLHLDVTVRSMLYA